MLFKRKICYVLILVLCMLQFSACKSKTEDTDNASVAVFTINDQTVYLDEVLYRVWEYEDEHSYYSNDFKEQYGEIYWDSEIVEGTTVAESLKEELYEDIVRDFLLYEQAQEKGYTLTDEEKEVIKEEAGTEFSAMPEEVKKSIGTTEDLMVRRKERKQLISTYFSELLDTYKVDEQSIKESVDQEDYEQLDVQTIGFSKFVYDQKGNETKKSEEESKMGLEILQEIAEEAKETEDFNDFLTGDSDILETEELSIIPGESACDIELEETALTMEPGDTSDVIETEHGYYIIRLLDNTSEDAYKETVEHAVLNEKYKLFDADFEMMKEKASIQTTDEWDKITIGGTVIKES